MATIPELEKREERKKVRERDLNKRVTDQQKLRQKTERRKKRLSRHDNNIIELIYIYKKILKLINKKRLSCIPMRKSRP